MRNMKRKVQQGFTLIELMIVVAIIGILAAIAIPQYQDYVTRSKLSKIVSWADPLKTAVAMYAQENAGATLPSTWASYGLSGTITNPDVTIGAANSVATGAIVLSGFTSIDGLTSVTFTPTVNASSVDWGVTCGGAQTANTKKVFGTANGGNC